MIRACRPSPSPCPSKLLNYALAAIIIGFGFFPDRIVELAKAAAKTLL